MPLDLPEPLVRAMAYRESMYRLGFADDEVAILFGRTIVNATHDPGATETQCEVILVDRRRVLPGNKVERSAIRFSVVCGPVSLYWSSMAGKTQMIERWNQLPNDERHALWQLHQPTHLFMGLAEALARKGITAPRLAANTEAN